jgi:hypothetical protein
MEIKFWLMFGAVVMLIQIVHHGFSVVDQWLVKVADRLKAMQQSLDEPRRRARYRAKLEEAIAKGEPGADVAAGLLMELEQ